MTYISEIFYWSNKGFSPTCNDGTEYMKQKYVHTWVHKFGRFIQKKLSYLHLSIPLKMQLKTGNQLIAMRM